MHGKPDPFAWIDKRAELEKALAKKLLDSKLERLGIRTAGKPPPHPLVAENARHFDS
jgi:hypothetical protein